MSSASSSIRAGAAGDSFNGRDRRFIALLVGVPTVGLLSAGAFRDHRLLARSWQEVAVWVAALALLNLMEIPAWRGLNLTPDLPLVLGAAVLFSPFVAGLIGFLGTVDRREFRSPIRVASSLFNRSQEAIALALASWAVSPFVHGRHNTSGIVIATCVALVVTSSTNYFAVTAAVALMGHMSARRALTHLTLGTPADYAFTWMAWGLMALLLVAAYDAVGAWAVIVFALTAILGRQVLARSESVVQSRADVEAKRLALEEMINRISDEREDERHRIASHLHDEVLPPVYQVSLLSTVIMRELESGELLQIDKDVPLLKKASELACENLRQVVTSLRASPIGLHGLKSSLRALIRDLQTQSRTDIQAEIGELGEIDPTRQLVVYQTCKEALSNAVRHSRAGAIRLMLVRDTDHIRFSVEDDGIGFDPLAARQGHFGLLIMRERVEAMSGTLYVDSWTGGGSIVAGRVPLE